MDRKVLVDNFINAIEMFSSSICTVALEEEKQYLDNLIMSILSYAEDKFSSIPLTKEEINDCIEKVYKKKHLNLKRTIDTNIGQIKYKMEDLSADINQIIDEEINKYKTLFMSVNAGTNISYLGLVDECTENVMSVLIRKNNTISFAKRTDEVREYIYNLINTNFFKVMVVLGDKFLDDGILPIQNDFPPKGNIKSKEFGLFVK